LPYRIASRTDIPPGSRTRGDHSSARYYGKIVGADLVEFNPKRDVSCLTAMVCAKIPKEILGKMIAGETTERNPKAQCRGFEETQRALIRTVGEKYYRGQSKALRL
jgi:hypothetical protein